MSNIQASGILEYGLKTILPANCIVTLDVEEQIVTLTDSGHIKKHIVLTPRQIMLLLPLLNAFPKYVPYEEMLSIFTNYDVRACKTLIDEDGAANLRPVRDLLTRLSKKLLLLGIKIVTIMDNGFILERKTIRDE